MAQAVADAATSEKERRHKKPKVRAECINGPRPCPYVSCRHHLFLDVTKAGSLKFPFGMDESALTSMPQTCSLDVAEQGERSYEQVATYLNVVGYAAQLTAMKSMARMANDGTWQELSNDKGGEIYYHEAWHKNRRSPKRIPYKKPALESFVREGATARDPG